MNARACLHHRGRGLIVPTALCIGIAGCATTSRTTIDDQLGLDPQDSPAALYVEMAEEYYRRGQPEIAFRRAQQAIEADQRYPKAHVWIALMYEEMGRAELAAEHYRRALQLAPNNSDILLAYGDYACRQQRYAEADQYFKRALENPLYATPWVPMFNAGVCAESAGDAPQAERYFLAAVEANPALGPALVKLAAIELRRGNPQGAKFYMDRYFEPTTLRFPRMARLALETAIQTERELGNTARAAEYEALFRQAFPNSSVSLPPQLGSPE
ncbi:type IV pilus biogenesis/stability protein PilW [Thiocapsa imhoffii]|uniref:Type IV pilus biogenesis/stability protein PilW n=1 Tax=Thiocapsa imhoffii TaxID=382777 RepID=A0A9X1B9V7_9GAMM|nr:type IV pilus biogenesis/stability protein PilW [Thiocapsa imhoffii]MBK1646277.1 type IV pilus biogenesis/stability protein PilW [Thiocapsa imhoffii]